jgi:Phosphotransferase enzyme family
VANFACQVGLSGRQPPSPPSHWRNSFVADTNGGYQVTAPSHGLHGSFEYELARVVEWLEESIGGKVTAIARQPRWRPVWFADIERDGRMLPLCVRGDRVDSIVPWDLEHEMTLFVEFERAGIPVPHVYGWLDDPRAFVMDRAPGQSNFWRSTDEEKRTAIDEYLRTLAQIHRLDVRPFAEAGVTRAERPEDSGRVGIQRVERAYRAAKAAPDPMTEFVLGWFRRNPLDNHGRESVIVWDSFQFHHDHGRLTAVLDLEVGHIGDPLMDIAGLRSREPYLRYGDIGDILARYEEHGGVEVDYDAVDYYFIQESILNQMSFGPALAKPPPTSDYTMNLTWVHLTNIWALEILAARLGVAIERPELRESHSAATFTAAPHAHMAASMKAVVDTSSDYEQYQARAWYRLAEHLQRLDDVGAEVLEGDLADLGALLGWRPTTWDEGEAELERFVLADEGRHDAEIIDVLHRRNWRHWATIALPGSPLARWEPIQHLGTTPRSPPSPSALTPPG